MEEISISLMNTQKFNTSNTQAKVIGSLKNISDVCLNETIVGELVQELKDHPGSFVNVCIQEKSSGTSNINDYNDLRKSGICVQNSKSTISSIEKHLKRASTLALIAGEVELYDQISKLLKS